MGKVFVQERFTLLTNMFAVNCNYSWNIYDVQLQFRLRDNYFLYAVALARFFLRLLPICVCSFQDNWN